MATAKDIMTSNPTCCKETDSIYDAVRVMKMEDCGVVPIVDDQNRCCGIVTDRDICLDVVLNDLDVRGTELREVMTRNVITCTPDDDLNNVLNQMERNQIKRIVVCGTNKEVLGIISEYDIAQKLQDSRKTSEFVENVYS